MKITIINNQCEVLQALVETIKLTKLFISTYLEIKKANICHTLNWLSCKIAIDTISQIITPKECFEVFSTNQAIKLKEKKNYLKGSSTVDV